MFKIQSNPLKLTLALLLPLLGCSDADTMNADGLAGSADSVDSASSLEDAPPSEESEDIAEESGVVTDTASGQCKGTRSAVTFTAGNRALRLTADYTRCPNGKTHVDSINLCGELNAANDLSRAAVIRRYQPNWGKPLVINWQSTVGSGIPSCSAHGTSWHPSGYLDTSLHPYVYVRYGSATSLVDSPIVRLDGTPVPDGYYPPINFYLRPDEVKSIFDTASAGSNICAVGGLGSVFVKGVMTGVYTAAIGFACGQGFGSQKDAVAKAYYNHTGAVCSIYIHKGIMSLNYTSCAAP